MDGIITLIVIIAVIASVVGKAKQANQKQNKPPLTPAGPAVQPPQRSAAQPAQTRTAPTYAAGTRAVPSPSGAMQPAHAPVQHRMENRVQPTPQAPVVPTQKQASPAPQQMSLPYEQQSASAPQPVAAYTQQPQKARTPVLDGMELNAAAMRRMVVMKEILDRPVALRHRQPYGAVNR